MSSNDPLSATSITVAVKKDRILSAPATTADFGLLFPSTDRRINAERATWQIVVRRAESFWHLATITDRGRGDPEFLTPSKNAQTVPLILQSCTALANI